MKLPTPGNRLASLSTSAENSTVENSLQKAGLLSLAIEILVNQPEVSATVLSKILGIWIWGAILRRALLVIPHSLFTMLDTCPDQVLPWWPSARRELAAMGFALPLMWADVGSPLATTVLSSDAVGINDYDFGGVESQPPNAT